MPGIPIVLQQHAEQAALIWRLRSDGARRPNFALIYLDRFDRRLDAHLDGLRIAGEDAWRFCDALLDDPSPGAAFVIGYRSIDEHQTIRLERLFAVTAAVPALWHGVTSAFAWHERDRLQGLVAGLLTSSNPWNRATGIAACALHRVDPGKALMSGLTDGDSIVRARALRAAGELGSREALRDVLRCVDDDNVDCARWAAWSGVMLGHRGKTVRVLLDYSASGPRIDTRAMTLVLQSSSPDVALAILRERLSSAKGIRTRLLGVAGDPAAMPELLESMAVDKLARAAGEAFSLMTGLDLALSGLDQRRPENFESGPNDNPDDPNVDMDPDDGLPWPDAKKVEAWWQANAARFQKGTRYFMGQPVTKEHCIQVLKTGYQRQRILAAQYLCLLEPGTPLFNTAAPAWRQQRLLAAM